MRKSIEKPITIQAVVTTCDLCGDSLCVDAAPLDVARPARSTESREHFGLAIYHMDDHSRAANFGDPLDLCCACYARVRAHLQLIGLTLAGRN